jgi:transcriptional regulator with GAF, ATPase, and Fis domain
MSTHPSTLIRSTDSSAHTGRQTGTPITCAEQFRTRRIARGRSGDTKKPAQFHRLSDARPTSREICEASHLQTDAVSEPSEHNCFAGIVGASPALRRTLDQVLTVAPTDATVLIEGETGTGKELIARAVHNLSPRRDRTFVRFNCAAIPLGLLESELFGHEKGAFTGAIARKMGRFELAHNGTLFLDEIGDIPLELQAKLLRVLQEQEFERLGSNQTQQVSVRIVAATHRNLKQMVAQGLFRSDLYFRLNIFPVVVPPLRERREDIPLLVKAFVRHCVRRMNRCVEAVTDETMKALMQYTWPGNVRELQNFIERAVIMSPDTLLQAPLDSLVLLENTITDAPRTLAQAESTYILDAVKEANWVIGGSKGAAKRLGLKRTTLIGKMRKLGLSRSREAAAIGRSLG